MKLIAIGDIHGRDIWKHIGIAEERFDKFVFIGDYFDSKDKISPQQQIENFNEIVAFKNAFPDKVILLIGNHDFHYLKEIKETYTGYQYFHRNDIQDVLQKANNEKQIQVCYVHDNYLFSHAGFSKTWCAANQLDTNSLKAEFEQQANALFYNAPSCFKFTRGENQSSSGDDITQSPIWIRPESLRLDKIDYYIQVVGHTMQYNLKIENDIILIDTLGTSKEYLVIDDNGISIKKV